MKSTIPRKARALLACALLMLPLGGVASAAAPSAPAAVPAAAQAAAVSASPGAFVQVEADYYTSTALRADGTVWTWGRRTLFGENGVNDPHTSSQVSAPLRIAGLSGIVSIAGNGSGAMAGLRTDGTVWTWGGAYDANGSNYPSEVPGLADVVRTAAVAGGGFALKRDGTLWAWTGAGADKQIRQVQGTCKWTFMTASGAAVYALDDAGALWTAGIRTGGQSEEIVPPSRVKGLPALKQIDVNGDYNQIYGVDAGGTAWVAKLGGAAVKPAKLAPQLKAAEVRVSGDTALVLTTQGEVWAFGKWLTGKTGKVSGLSGIRSIDAGYHHALAIDKSGKLWGWGGNQYYEAGALERPQDSMLYAPVRVQTAVGVTVDGRPLATAFPSFIKDGYTYIPLRDVVKALGGTLAVSGDYTTYTIVIQSYTAVFSGNEATVNGQAVRIPPPIPSGSGAYLVPGALLKLMGVSASWDSKLGELTLSAGAAAGPQA